MLCLAISQVARRALPPARPPARPPGGAGQARGPGGKAGAPRPKGAKGTAAPGVHSLYPVREFFATPPATFDRGLILAYYEGGLKGTAPARGMAEFPGADAA
jgi:hypothetical protein